MAVPRLLLAVYPDNLHLRGVCEGIEQAAAEQGWQVCLVEPEASAIVHAMPQVPIAAGILHGMHPSLQEAMLARTPVAISLQYRSPLPRVVTDDDSIGATAAAHFHDLGVAQAAFVTERDEFTYADRRCAAFIRALAQHHIPFLGCAPLLSGERMVWLAGLPSRTGLFCANDVIAYATARLIGQHGHRIGRELFILGVDDDPILCRFCTTPLSSIPIDTQALGRAAVALAVRLRTQPTAASSDLVVRVPCQPVVARDSSGRSARTTPASSLGEALAFIDGNFTDPLSVAAVAQALGIPVRTLEHQFRRHLAKSVAEVIREARIRHACGLLITTSHRIDHIASTCGYTSLSAFGVAFRRLRGMSPKAFRNQHRRQGSPGDET